MKVGYLLNTYPMVTTTFIRREMQALEAHQVEVVRYAIRPWSGNLVDEQDRGERARTRYLFTGRIRTLIRDFLIECLTNPRGVARALRTWAELVRNAGGQVVRHAAYFLEAVSLKRWTTQDRVGHLHTHFSTNAAAVAMLAQRLGGPTYSLTAHGPDEFDNWDAGSVAEKVAGAQFVVAISHYCRVQLARAAGMSEWEKIHVVRCGVNIDEYEAMGTPLEDNFTFVCVGRLCPQKAQTLIVEAVSHVSRTHPQVRVVLIGDGETRDEIASQTARLGLRDHVTVLGWQSNAEIHRMMREARALLLPSFAEGLPIVIMEAYTLERPVITTYIAGIPELVDRNCGWIVPAGSVAHLVQAMTEALDAPAAELAEMGKEGRRRVLDSHDVFKNADILRGLLAEFCREPRGD